MPGLLARSNAARTLRALLLLGTLVLGAAFHVAHHLADPGCDNGTERAQHFCGCSGLHASTLVAAEQAAPVPVGVAWRVFVAPGTGIPAAATFALASPRAPPAS
jgi:hypothetical protein